MKLPRILIVVLALLIFQGNATQTHASFSVSISLTGAGSANYGSPSSGPPVATSLSIPKLDAFEGAHNSARLFAGDGLLYSWIAYSNGAAAKIGSPSYIQVSNYSTHDVTATITLIETGLTLFSGQSAFLRLFSPISYNQGATGSIVASISNFGVSVSRPPLNVVAWAQNFDSAPFAVTSSYDLMISMNFVVPSYKSIVLDGIYAEVLAGPSMVAAAPAPSSWILITSAVLMLGFVRRPRRVIRFGS
jgi:hypothetical protein